jgi:arylsulfatase A-like enzyme
VKYVRDLAGNEADELYDLRADPDELTNLAGDARYQATLENFRDQWLHELQMTDVNFLEHVAPPAAAR